MNPLVSCILPVRHLSDSARRTMSSVVGQTYPELELVVVAAAGVQDFDPPLPRTRVVRCEAGKNAARNAGVDAAQGHFVLLVDDDMVLPPTLVADAVAAAEANGRPVVIAERRVAGSSVLSRGAELESRLASGDGDIAAPRFLERSLYLAVGGIDPRLDPIDEGDLRARLDEHRVPFARVATAITVEEGPVRVRRRASAKFRRGRKMMLFQAVHPRSSQFAALRRGRAYLARSSGAPNEERLGLLLLKLVDVVAVHFGRLATSRTDRRAASELRNRTVFEVEANSYEDEFYLRTRGARHVDEVERRHVEALLPTHRRSPHLHVDIGTGGGRWTRLLAARYPDATGVAVDLSWGMLKGLGRRGATVMPVQSDMTALPFRPAVADLVICIRAAKYARSVQGAIAEAAQLLVPGGVLVLELPYPNAVLRSLRWLPSRLPLADYARRISLLGASHICASIEAAGLRVDRADRLFTTPATAWKRADSPAAVRLLSAIDSALPRSVLARSLFVRAVKPPAA